MATIPVVLENGGEALKTANALLAAIREHTAETVNEQNDGPLQQYEAETAAKLGEALDAVTRYIEALSHAQAPVSTPGSTRATAV